MEKSYLCDHIAHSTCINGHVERCDCNVFKLDDADGLAEGLGFLNNQLSKVDYFTREGDCIQFIELTDLRETINDCVSERINIEQKQIQAKDKRKLRKKLWAPCVCEFKNKWFGSIAVIERLYRKNIRTKEDPSYSLLIVCKDGTDIRMLDALKTKLQGMMGEVTVTTTADAPSFIAMDCGVAPS